MRYRILSVILSSLSIGALSFSLSSCSPEHSRTVLAEFGNDKITLGEFENVYAKNTGGYTAAQKDSLGKLKNFLDLYVNFKMKLKDAQVRGFDKNPSLNAELKDYKEKIGVSYLLEKDIVTPGIETLYDQLKYELRVSHIMIRPDSTGDENARKLTAAIIDSLNNGKSWDEMTRKYSTDFYSKGKGGDIYYITAGMISPDFEEYVYKTPVGTYYPEPVKTKWGYHVIKVTDKRPRLARLRAAHIMIDFKDDSSRVDSAAALAKIKDIKSQLDKGADFAKLAEKYSEDPGSAKNGGDLGFFERGMMVKEFDETAFNLKVGEVSGIIKTVYGYHIIKALEHQAVGPFESEKENLKKLFRKTRYDAAYNNYVAGLKNKYSFSVNQPVAGYIAKNSDSTKVGSAYWESNWRTAVKDTALFYIDKSGFTVDSVFNKIQDVQQFANRIIDAKLINEAVNSVGAEMLLTREASQLDKRDSQFASLMDDYKNGIYIFKLQDEEIWGKIKLDSLKLVEYYEKNKEKYRWNNRVAFSEIYATNDSLINRYYDMLTKGENFDSLAKKFTERSGFREKAGAFQLMDTNASLLATKANELSVPGSYTKPFKSGTGFSIVRLNSKDAARLKSFEEAKAEVSGAYQESESKRLEDEYISSLKNLYKPVTHYDKLEEAFKNN